MDALDDVAAVVKKPTKKRLPSRRGPVPLTMPKRPPCSGLDQEETQIIYVYLKPGNRSLYLRIDCLDWLVSYAADEHHFQRIVREVPQALPGTAVADWRVEWDFNDKVWEGTVLVGEAAGQSLRFCPQDLSKSHWDRLEHMSLVPGLFSKSSQFTRKLAAKEFVKLWCGATHHGKRGAFETEWCDESPYKKLRDSVGVDGAPAVAEITLNTEPSAVADITVKTETSSSSSSTYQAAVGKNHVVEILSSYDE